MADHSSDFDHNDLEIRRLFRDIEHSIKTINREIISEIAGDVSREAFLNVARSVARIRARYLSKVLELEDSGEISGNDISALRGTRLMYEESLEGFSALQHALKRGYFTLSDD